MYEFLQYRVVDAMTRKPIVIGPETSLAEAGALFESHNFNALPVTRGGRLVGVFTKLDFLKGFAFTTRSMIPPYEALMQKPVDQFMTCNPLTVFPDMPLTRVLQEMIDSRYKSFPVVEQGALVGIISREDILRALRYAVSGNGAKIVPE